MAYLGGFDPSTSLRTSEVRCKDYTTQHNQHPGFDDLEVFAPTVRPSSIRVILTLAALQDLHLHSLDISHAYLNGEMDCEVYMAQPEGFVEGDPKAKVCLLFR